MSICDFLGIFCNTKSAELNISSELFKGLISIISIILASAIAIRTYFRQKEYELVKDRYLEHGVDAVFAHHELSQGVIRHNFAKTMWLLKAYRELGEGYEPSNFPGGFLELKSDDFNLCALERVERLVGSDIFSTLYLRSYAQMAYSNFIIKDIIPSHINIRIDSEKRKKYAEIYIKNIKDEMQTVLSYVVVSGGLQEISYILESEKMKFIKIKKFRYNSEVKKLVKDMLSFHETLDKNMPDIEIAAAQSRPAVPPIEPQGAIP